MYNYTIVLLLLIILMLVINVSVFSFTKYKSIVQRMLIFVCSVIVLTIWGFFASSYTITTTPYSVSVNKNQVTQTFVSKDNNELMENKFYSIGKVKVITKLSKTKKRPTVIRKLFTTTVIQYKTSNR